MRTLLLVAVLFLAAFSGCATRNSSPQSAAPRISGYIDTGASKHF
jgi:hypothetical protein